MQLFRNKAASLTENQILTSKRSSALLAQEMGLKSGFTLVEIIIVLAIVGLIFVIIFLAVAAAQRGQQDTARKDNVNRVFAAIQQYAGNNNGTFPTTYNTCSGGCTSGLTIGGSTTVKINSPVTAVAANSSGANANTTLGWSAAACASGTLGGTRKVEITLSDGNLYCKDY